MKPNPWQDVDEISDRQPAYCPYCGHNGSFDGQGSRGKGKYQCRCGECGQQFITIEPKVDV